MIHCYTWSTEQVGQWLYDIGLSHLSNLFIQNSIDGKSLLMMDSARIKQMGIATKEKAVLKKRLKDLRSAYDKERKQLEKDQKSKVQ
ncbi:Spn [Bugula neritina]|uniref:Spn n=1 Tax=Bugula neritina TaxID=10212 RepID=A0A7J7JB58_BUGNE|nr:Spn [Bugula neritina]